MGMKKSADVVVPVTYRFPCESVTDAVMASTPLPPRSVAYVNTGSITSALVLSYRATSNRTRFFWIE